MVTINDPREIRIQRVYNAPVAVVWDAWNDPEQVGQWWGPRGFTLTSHSKDLRPGGHWSYTMHGPDGTDYENTTIYHEVEVHKKLVYDHGGHKDRPPLFRVTALFSEENGKTTLVVTMRLPTAEEAEKTRKFIKAAGGNATWDRLAEYLAETTQSTPIFVINRTLAATPQKLFDAWIDPDQLAKWLPPPGFAMTIGPADVRVGGKSSFKMSDGESMLYGEFEYREIARPDKLVYIQRFCDEHGQLGRHPALPDFPDALLTTVNFVAEDEAMTRMTLVCEPYGAATASQLAVFEQIRASMTGGWTASFDKLELAIWEC